MLKKNFDCSNAATFTRCLRPSCKENEPIHIRAWGEPNEKEQTTERERESSITSKAPMHAGVDWKNNQVKGPVAARSRIETQTFSPSGVAQANSVFQGDTQSQMNVDSYDAQDAPVLSSLPSDMVFQSKGVALSDAQVVDFTNNTGACTAALSDKTTCNKPPLLPEEAKTIVGIDAIVNAKTKKQLLRTLNAIVPMKRIVGLDYGEVSPCFLVNHPKTMSIAEIYHEEDGDVYSCPLCKSSPYSIIEVQRALMKKQNSKDVKISTVDVISAVLQLIGVNLTELFDENEYKQQMKFLSSDAGKKQYPALAKRLQYRGHLFEPLALFALLHVYEDPLHYAHDGLIFSASYEQLKKFFRINDRTSIHDTLALFSLLGLIQKLNNEEIPEAFLKRALKKKKKDHRLIGFYKIMRRTKNDFSASEEKAKLLETVHFCMGSIDFEPFYYLFGRKEALRVYPALQNDAERLANNVSGRKSLKKYEKLECEYASIMKQHNFILLENIVNTKANNDIRQTVVSACIQKYGWCLLRLTKKIASDFSLEQHIGKYILTCPEDFES